MKKFLPALLIPLAVVACQDTREPLAVADAEPVVSSGQVTPSGIIPGRFIVTVRDGTDPAAVARGHGASPQYVYRTALNGFAGAMSEAARAGLLRDARVVRVEPDGMAFPTTIVQEGATWGIDRVDQRSRPLDGKYHYNATGTGVTVYIIDSGIRFSHNEFGGRARNGRDFVQEQDPSNTDPSQGPGEDCNGHGTHVAGTVGGNEYGVAKNVNLVSVRVFGCSGGSTWSRIIAAMEWVITDAQNKKPAVANMSLGGGANSSVDDATRSMIASGVATAVAAGNDSQDACRSSPARVREAMTIGSTTRTDERSSFSNVGECVDWFAPGSSIMSAWWTSDTDTRSISGTSMASPHVAGVAALYLQNNRSATAAQVFNALYDATTKTIVSKSRTANNHLLYSLGDWGSNGGAGGGTTPSAPAAPSGLSATAVSTSAIDLRWTDNSNNEDEFWIERCQGTSCTNFLQIATVGANVTSFRNTGLSASTTYRYRVRAYNAGGNSGFSNTASATTAAASGAGPSDLTLRGYKLGGRMTVDLTWVPGTPASVDIWRQAGTGGTWERYRAGLGNSGSFTDSTNFIGSGTLSYQVCEAGVSRGSSACTNAASWTF